MLTFSKDGDRITCRTRKGSTVVIYCKDGYYNWFIDEGRELPPLTTQQTQERSDHPPFLDGWRTAEEAIDNCISAINSVYNTQLTWRITND